MIFAGIDYSISSPAVCVYNSDLPFKFSNLDFFAMPLSKKIDGVYDNIRVDQNLGPKANPMDRYETLADGCVNFMKVRGVTHAFLENYAFSARGRVFHIGENCGLLKYKMHKAGIIVDVIAPTEAKKFATGKGNAKKEEMVAQFKEDTGVDLWEHFIIANSTKSIPSPIDDLADSYFLLKCGLNKYDTKEN